MSLQLSQAIRAVLPCSVTLAALICSAPVAAQQRATAIHIEAQSVESALRELSRQTNINVLFSPEAVQGLNAAAIDAEMTPEEAARAIIAGTTLEVVLDSTGALIVRQRVSERAQLSTRAQGPLAELEEIIVTGLRMSLQNAQEIKRESDTFVDSVTSSDIGAFPDRSVTEALQRVPGVAIDRFIARNDPDHFSIEGSGLSVRGLTQVRSEFNGRDIFTANSGRGLSFQDISPELMAGVDVYKNQSADLIEGGIGGVINLRTRLPFDTADRVMAVSADASYADFADEWTPSYSALFSDRHESSFGEFGLLMNYAHSELRARTDGVQVEPFFARTDLEPGRTVLVPRGGAIRRIEHEREREGITVAGQWESTDGTLRATAQFVRSEATQAWTEHAVEFDADHLSTLIFPAAGTQFEYDDRGVFTNGVLTSRTGWHGGDPRTLAFPLEFGAQHHIDNRINKLDTQVEDFAFNLLYSPGDTWALSFDGQYVESSVQNLDWAVFGAAYANAAIDLRGDRISVVLQAPDASNDAAYLIDPAHTFWRSAQDHIEDSDGHELALRSDLDLDLDGDFLDALRFGVRYSDRKQNTRYAQYNWGVLSEVWSSTPPPATWFDQALQEHQEVFSFSDFFRGERSDPGTWRYPGTGLIMDYETAKALLRPIAADWASNASGNDWRPIDQREGSVGNFRPSEIHVTTEKTEAVYALLKFGGGRPLLGSVALAGNIGVRYVRTADDTAGYEVFPDLATPAICADGSTSSLLNARCVLAAGDRAFGNGASFARKAQIDYDDILPSLNLTLGLTPELLVRFGASRAISRPELGLLRNYVDIDAGADVIGFNSAGERIDPNTIPASVYQLPPNQVPAQYIPVRGEIGTLDGSGTGYRANAGNPVLKPMQANQFDLSLEWYFAPGGSLTATLFYKDIESFFVNGIVARQFVNNGERRTVNVATVTNGEQGSIRGVETTYQQFYDFLPGWLAGLGMQANYTFIESEGAVAKNYDTTIPAVSGAAVAFDNIPLEGLSKHNANLVLIYERGALSTRFAYNWRSQYLLTTRDVITALPVYQDDTGQLDATAFCSLTPRLKVGVEVVNLTNEVTVLEQQFDNDRTLLPRANFVNDRRYSFVLRAAF